MESRKLGMREYMAIAIIMVGAKATDSNPALVYSKVQNAAWMVPLLSAVIFFVGLFLLLKTHGAISREKLVFRYPTITRKVYRLLYLPCYISHQFFRHFVRF